MVSNIDETKPVTGIDQPAKVMRDNFTIAKIEITELQARKLNIDGTSTLTGPLELASFTLAELPPAIDNEGSLVYVTDSAPASPFFSDGLTWSAIGAGGGGGGLFNVVEDLNPQLGGALDAQLNKIVNLGFPIADTDAVTKLYVDTEILTASAITNMVDDLTPQLGGQLDVNTFGLGDGINLLLDFVEDASAVNHIEIENEATGSGPIIRSAGADTNIDLELSSKGTGVINITGNVTVSGTVDGRNLSVDGTKLDGIELGATVDQTAADIRGLGFFDITNDGTGSELDADLLDGNHASAFATAAQGTTADSALQNVVEDTTPQLGGQLDADNFKIINLATPTAGGDVTNKTYVDSLAAGLDPKESVRLATVGGDLAGFVFTNNGGVGDVLTAPGAGFTSVDGLNLADGDRVLVKNQATASQNGIYVASATGSGGTTVLTRATDQDGTPSNEISAGNFTFVETGSANGSTGWVVIGDGIITVNVGDIDWAKFSDVSGALVNIVDDTTPQLGGTLDTNGNNITMTGAETVDGRDLSVDGTKLDLIEANAKDDQTAADIRGLGFFDITNDGTASGLDADLLDGNHASAFATAAQGTTADSALQNIVEDTTPQLGAQLDVNTFGLGDGTNLLLDFVEDASAVNHIEIENEATGSGPVIRAVGADTNIDLLLEPKGTGEILVGIDTADAVITSADAPVSSGNAGRSLTIGSGSGDGVGDGGDILITPGTAPGAGTDGTLVLAGLVWPIADGTSGQVLTTDGAGNLSFTVTAGTGLFNIIEDTTPQLGAQLDVNTFGLGDGTNLLLDFVEDASAVNYIQIENEEAFLGPIIRAVGADTNVDLNLEPKGTGNIVLSGLKWPTADGTLDQFIRTDGFGNLSFFSAKTILVDDLTPQLGAQLDVNTFGLGDGTNLLLDFVEDASAVNHIEIENEATGSGPVIRAVGADTNVDIIIEPKGTGDVIVGITGPSEIRGALNENLTVGGGNSDATATGGDTTIISGDGSGAFASGTIFITPGTGGAGDGDLVLNGLIWPIVDGSSGQALTTNGSGTLGFGSVGSMNDVVDDSTPQLGGTLDTNGNNITMTGAETVDGRDLSVDGSKLDLIEANAKDDQTAADIRGLGFFDITNDGTGSSLDADLLDGSEGTEFAKKADNNTFTKAQRGAPVAIASSATITPDFDAGNNFDIDTIAINFTLANPTNMTNAAGQSGAIVIVQDGTGSRLLSAVGGFWKFPGGTLPVLSTAIGSVDTITYYVRNSTFIVANVILDSQ